MTSLFVRKKKSTTFEPLPYEDRPAATPPIPVNSGQSPFDFTTPKAARSSVDAPEQQDDRSQQPLSPQRSLRSIRSVKSQDPETRERRMRESNEQQTNYRPSSRSSNVSDTNPHYSSSTSLSSQRDPNGTMSSRTTNHTMSSSTSSYAPSIRSVGSSAANSSSYSIHSAMTGMTTPQPASTPQMSSSSTMPPPASRKSARASRTSSLIPNSPVPSLAGGRFPDANDFDFPRPNSPAEIERMFAEIVNRSVQGDQRDEMLRFPIDKKWQMVLTEKHNEHANAKSKKRSSKAAAALGFGHMSTASSSSRGTDHESMLGSFINSNKKGKGRADGPEFYLSSFLDGTVDHTKVQSLNVGLRTYEVGRVLFTLLKEYLLTLSRQMAKEFHRAERSDSIGQLPRQHQQVAAMERRRPQYGV